MSKKFLPFSGRIAYRKNGLIDITSPDEALGGFRVTLKPGTDSHTLAGEALAEANLFPSHTAQELYAADLNAEAGLLAGVDEAGQPLYLPLPKPGGILWVLGSTHAGGLVSILGERFLSLRGEVFNAYGVKSSSLISGLPEKLQSHFQPMSEEWKKFLTSPSREGLVSCLPLASVQLELLETISDLRRELAYGQVVPIIGAWNPGTRVDFSRDVVVVTDSIRNHQDYGVPSSTDWAKNVPLGSAFLIEDEGKTAKRFRTL